MNLQSKREVEKFVKSSQSIASPPHASHQSESRLRIKIGKRLPPVGPENTPSSVKTKVVSSVQKAHTQPGIFCDSGHSGNPQPPLARNRWTVNCDPNKERGTWM